MVHGYLEQLDQYSFQSINGDLGGTWAPSSPIIIGGAGLTLTATLTAAHIDCSAGIHVSAGAVTFDGSSGVSIANQNLILQSTCFAQLLGGAEFKGGGNYAIRAGSTFQIDSGATVNIAAGATVNIAALANFTGNIQATTGTFSGAVVVNGTLDVTASATQSVEGVLSLFSQGHINFRPLLTAINSNDVKGVNDGDGVIVLSSSLTADRQLTVTSTGASAGSRFLVYSQDPSYALSLKQDNGTLIAILKRSGSTNFYWVELEHGSAASSWRVIAGQVIP
jgi:hypothetical protein